MVFHRSAFPLAHCNFWVWGEVGDGVFGFPGVQGWDDTWFLKSTPPSIPAGENQLHFDLKREAGEGGRAGEFTPGSPWGNSHIYFFLRSLVCVCWHHNIYSGSESLVLVSSIYSLELDLWHPSNRVMAPEFTCIIPVSTLFPNWVLRVVWGTFGFRKGLNRVPSLYYLEQELNLSLCCSYNTKL